MKKEFFKTMLLYFLVITSLFLTVNIWSGKELWSDDYSSFVYSVKNFFTDNQNELFVSKTSVSSSDCYSLKWLSLSCDDKKTVLYLGEEKYKEFYDFLSVIKTDISKLGTVSLVNDEDFLNSLKGNGICVKFSSYVSLCDYLKCEDTFFDDVQNPYSDLIFLSIPADSAAMKYLYFSDKTTKNNYRLPINYSNDNVSERLSSLVKTDSSSAPYSFELNFDRKNNDVDRILIDSFVPVSLEETNITVLDANSIDYATNGTVYDSVFKAFNIKKNSARSYTDADGVIGFIENHATLKIYDNAVFQYETDGDFEGISIGENSIIGAVSFVNNLYKSCVDNTAYLCLEKIFEENDTTTYEFSYATSGGSLYTTEESCVTMKVKKGNVVFFKQHLLDISPTDRKVNVGTLLNAYDDMYNTGLSKTKSDLSVVNLYPVNVFDKNGSTLQKWYVEFSDGTSDFL